MKSKWCAYVALVAMVGSWGCKEKSSGGEDTVVDVVEEDVAVDTSEDVAVDTSEDVAVEDVAEEDGPPPGPCETLGLDVRDFVTADQDPARNATAADFSIALREGMWTLGENWTGCDVYLFIPDEPWTEQGMPVGLWTRDVGELFDRLPRNVHLFFVSTDPAWVNREAALDDLTALVDAQLAGMAEEERVWWQDRIHYVTAQHSQVGGWLQTTLQTNSGGVGIDRFQRVRLIGTYADPSRYYAAAGWFQPNLSYVAHEANYYNHETEREERLQGQGATVVNVFDEQVMSDPEWAGVRTAATVTLPDATTMEGFDSMELDLTMACTGADEYYGCPLWDYIAHLYLCDESDPDVCDVELGRWITTYHREGRWVHDVSALIPLLASGGERRFEFYTQQEYSISLDIRLYDAGKEHRPVQATYLYSGATFDGTYNDSFDPVTVPIPADAGRVEVVSVITGHGGADPGNCAEFCNTTHHFFVDGTENTRSFPQAGAGTDCMERVGEGVVPNQFGTWWYGRSGWCPGWHVPVESMDVTDQVTPGTDATIDYEGYYLGSPYPSSGASIRMASWLVVYD